MCVCVSSHISQFMCLADIVTCMDSLQVAVLLCTVQSTVSLSEARSAQNDFTELLAVQHEELINEELMELEAQRKHEERQEEEITECIADSDRDASCLAVHTVC